MADANESSDWRIYLDFTCLHRLHLSGAFFVTRAKSNLKAYRVYSVQTDRRAGILCDQMTLPAATICALYKSRWQVDLFFKGIK